MGLENGEKSLKRVRERESEREIDAISTP